MTDNDFSGYLNTHTWGELGQDISTNRQRLDELENKADRIDDKINNSNSKIEKIHINIIQVVSVVVSVLALVLGNLFGVLTLPESMEARRLTGYLFVINGINLTGISFLIIIIKYLFVYNKKEKNIFYY
ncbi:hypothetical protein ACTWKD_08055 [Halanaerobium saccharolyticum]|uniref:hypothetical protein n=1 Tax=Halanaerobium saccharolyticum TaxID=43595 RepID=UPI003FCC451F